MRTIALATIVIAAIAAACAGSSASQQPKGGSGGTLTGPTWVLASYGSGAGSKSVPDAIAADAVFTSVSVSGFTGCNAYSGPYRARGATIEAGPFAATQAACAGPAGDAEQAFLDGMGSAATYTATADSLTMYDADGSASLVFKPGSSGSLSGATWHMTAYNNGNQGVQSAAAGSEVTAVFGDDGSISGNATCNQYQGRYVATAETIKIGPLSGTRMACASETLGAQESAYLAALQAATTYTVQGTRLELRGADGALLLQYASR